MKKRKDKKGVVSIVFVFLVLSVVLITLFGLVAPFGTKFTSETFVIGEKLINSSNQTISQIQNEDIKNSLNDIFSSTTATTQDNINVLTGMYKYAWIIILAIITLVLFLLTRALVEYSKNTGGII